MKIGKNTTFADSKEFLIYFIFQFCATTIDLTHKDKDIDLNNKPLDNNLLHQWHRKQFERGGGGGRLIKNIDDQKKRSLYVNLQKKKVGG